MVSLEIGKRSCLPSLGVDLWLLIGSFKVVEYPCVVNRIPFVLAAASQFYFAISTFISAYALYYPIRILIIVLFVGVGYRCRLLILSPRW